MKVEQDVIDEMGRRMAREIDFEILSGFLIELGWTKVILKPMTHEQSSEIDSWVGINVKGNHETMGLVWLFEKPNDANWFKLRWLS